MSKTRTKMLFLCAILPFQGFATAQPLREITSQAMLFAGQLTPSFYRGYVFLLDEGHRNHIRLYSPDGEPFLEKDIQEQLAPSVMSVVVDTDGAVAVSWAGFDTNGKRRAGIDFLNRNGNQIRSINTGFYLASHLAFGEGHDLWAFGWERDASDPERSSQDYMTVRKYSNGREVGAYLPRSLFPHGLNPACLSDQEPVLAVARDRVGVLACAGNDSEQREWVEMDFTGKPLGRWRVEPKNRIVCTLDGHVYAQNTNAENSKLFLLDRPSAAFKLVEWKTNGILFGADGDELVFLDSWNTGRRMHFRWFKQP